VGLDDGETGTGLPDVEGAGHRDRGRELVLDGDEHGPGGELETDPEPTLEVVPASLPDLDATFRCVDQPGTTPGIDERGDGGVAVVQEHDREARREVLPIEV
jgi:hypothetical protein